MTTVVPAPPGLAPADPDSLKDAEALAFLRDQPADVRAEWLERCRLLRWVDQLAERDRWGWQVFLRQWRGHQHTGDAEPRYGQLIIAVDGAWFDSADVEEAIRAARTFSSWLDALSADYGRSLVPETLEQHDAMVADVGGFFRLFPYLTPEQWEAIGAFGALDQGWNNVRDIAEDAEAGKCYFPKGKLRGFCVRREGLLSGVAAESWAWRAFARWWLDEHLPALAEDARPFLEATDLHPSVEALRASCLRRYARVERVLRGLEFDYRAFPEAYWSEVRREMAADALGAKEIET